MTWDDILVRAAECNIQPSLFWEMSWRDFMVCFIAYERRLINDMARTRSICYYIYLANTADNFPKKIHEFWPLPIDSEKKSRGKKLTEEELKNVIQRLSQAKLN